MRCCSERSSSVASENWEVVFQRIDIIDEGNGVPPEIQSRIFDPYFTTRSDGTGMGLALCDKIVRQHDGSIDFETSPRGSTFTVLLPR
ncbi:MAG: ATP-binding protein [Pirellula sp.]